MPGSSRQNPQTRRALAPGRRARKLVGRGSLFRNSVAGAVATVADFGMVSGLVKLGVVSVPVATFFGCVLGGAINFSINRFWAFESRRSYVGQIGRYIAVSTASALLNSAAVAGLLLVSSWPYQVTWALARGAVFIGFNYPLHRYYVFPVTGGATRL